MPTNEVSRLRAALEFLTSHLPGASELAEVAEKGSLALDSYHEPNPEQQLLDTTDTVLTSEHHQKALYEFREKRLNNLEVGRLYERYIGYLYEQDDWRVTFRGILDGFDDLGRDLICVKDDVHHIVQAKCWSRHKTIQVKYVYQLHSSKLHYRMQLRRTLRERYGQAEAGRRMQPINQNLKSVICSTTDLSETAQEVVRYLGTIEHRREPLRKDYPMIKCNINQQTREKFYHLPFVSTYDTIIIGNVDGESYVKTTREAENLGFRKVGQ